jgi:hypothetical protein
MQRDVTAALAHLRMVGLGKVEKGASLWLQLKKIATISSVTLFLVILLSHAVLVSIREKSIEPGLKEAGKRFTSSTIDLNNQSLAILDRQGFYDGSDGRLKGLWRTTWLYLSIFSSIFIIWMWITIFAKDHRMDDLRQHVLFQELLSRRHGLYRRPDAVSRDFRLCRGQDVPRCHTDYGAVALRPGQFISALPVAEGLARVESSAVVNNTLNSF